MRAETANTWAAFTRPCGTSFMAMVQLAHKAEPFPISENGKALLFPTKGAADRAAHKFLVAFFNSRIIAEVFERRLSEHEKLQADVFGAVVTRDDATPEKAFGVLYAKGRNGNSRQVAVQRKKSRRIAR